MKVTKPTSKSGGGLALAVGAVFVGVMTTCALTIGIWPGEIKLLAPFFCTDAQPDPFVVADTYNPRPGESVTNFSLYCMGPRGDATDHGFLKPFLLISVFHTLIFLFLMFIGIMTSAARTARRLTPAERAAVMDGTYEASSDEPDLDTLFAPTAPDSDDDESADERVSRPPPGSTAGPFVD